MSVIHILQKNRKHGTSLSFNTVRARPSSCGAASSRNARFHSTQSVAF